MSGWIVVRTKSLNEYRAKTNVERQGAESYLPVCRNQLSGRKEVMFPGYLFVLCEQGWSWLRNTYGVLSVVLTAGGAPAYMPMAELDALRAREDESGFIPLQPLFLKNDPVRITDGPFGGCIGLYQGRASSRVEVLLELLGRSTSVKVPSMLVESAV